MQEHEFRDQFHKLVFSKPPEEIIMEKFEKIMQEKIVDFSKDGPAEYGKAIAVYYALVMSIADYWKPSFLNAGLARKVSRFLHSLKEK